MYLPVVLIVLVQLVLIHCANSPVKILWQNDDFPSHDPIANFHRSKKGFFYDCTIDSVKDPAGGGKNVLRVFYAKGTYSGIHKNKGMQFYSHPTSNHTAMTLSYEVYFEPGFDFVRGGKLPGLSGGIEPDCSGGRHSPHCFSARFMWRREGDGEIYSYLASRDRGLCDRKDIVCSPKKGISLGRSTFRFKTGTWNKLTQHIHLNTVGKDDGFAKIFFNNKLVSTTKNLEWIKKSDVKISAIFFSTFFGGGDKDWATPKNTYSYFRRFVISMGSTPPLIG